MALFKVSLEAKRKHLKLAAAVDSTPNYKAMLSTSTIVTRCLNALTNKITIMGYECCVDLRDFPDHYVRLTRV